MDKITSIIIVAMDAFDKIADMNDVEKMRKKAHKAYYQIVASLHELAAMKKTWPYESDQSNQGDC